MSRKREKKEKDCTALWSRVGEDGGVQRRRAGTT